MITTANYHSTTQHIDWNAVPASLRKMHDTLIPDASKNDWEAFRTDEDVRRVVEKYFGYIAKYVSAPSESEKPVVEKLPVSTEGADRERAKILAVGFLRPYVERGETIEQINASYLGTSNSSGSFQVKKNKVFVDRIGDQPVNFSFPLRTIFEAIKGAEPKPRKASPKKAPLKTTGGDDLPEPKQVTFIPTATAFIKRYAGLHGKQKTRDQILSLLRGLQKAVTEQRIKASDPAHGEIEKMQDELIALAMAMKDSARIEIDEKSLKHYNEIAAGEEVRTSVKLLKSFLSTIGKAYDKVKAAKLCQRLEAALEVIPSQDPYVKSVASAITALKEYASGKQKTVGIPTLALNGLGAIAAGGGIPGLGALTKAECVIVAILRSEGIRTLSDSAFKKAFRKTAVPGLCLEIARGLVRRGDLTTSTLTGRAETRRSSRADASLQGIEAGDDIPSERGRFDLDLLEMRLKNSTSGDVAGLGNAEMQSAATEPRKKVPAPEPKKPASGSIMSAEALKTMKFETIGLTGKWKDLIGDPAPGFSAMVYGLPKQGKSTFCLQLANDLAKLGQVLYCALEEGFGATLAEKLNRLGIVANALQFANHIPSNLSRYKFIFIDSVSEAGMEAEGLRELRKANPKTAFIFIYHSTKAGNFRGSNTDAHDVDIIVEVKGGCANARGRYSPPNSIAI